MIIMIQLIYDLSFDKFHKNYDKIFRLEFASNTSMQAVMNRPLAEQFIESSPQILAGALTSFRVQTTRFHVDEDNGARNFYEENALIVTPSFFEVFSFDFVEGSTDTYIAPGNVFIPLSLSRKLFGNEPAVGRQIVRRGWGNQTVMAVYRDFPANSVISNCMFFAMDENEDKDIWGNWNYITYVRVQNPSSVSLIIDNFKRTFEPPDNEFHRAVYKWEEAGVDLRLTALPDIHFISDAKSDPAPKANKQTLMILLAIAIVIVVIASINFTNFSTALTPMRVKSINTQRVLGARQRTLRLSIISEAIIVSFLSYLLAICFVIWFSNTSLAGLVVAGLSIGDNLLIVAGTALIVLFTGLFAGLYPSFYMTSFTPALVVKGSFGLSPKCRQMRSILIGIQFVASFALIIGASFMYLQNHFMQNSPLGYEKDGIITANIGMIQENREVFANQLKSYSGIEDVTYGESLLSGSDQYLGWGLRYKGEVIDFQCLPVDYSFLQVIGIEITDGRGFRVEDAGMLQGVFVFNETAQKKYNLELNTAVGNRGEIIGFMPDVKFASFRKTIEPMAFFVRGTENGNIQPNNAYIKVKAGTDMRAAMSYIHTTLAEFAPEWQYPFTVRFYDEVMQRLYEKEIAFNLLITLFSLVAIFISIVGVFGLVVFDSECRRKEIGIRKMFGASTTGIILMFNQGYLRILLICFVLSSPLAWYAIHRWLENFAYRTPMYWWVYLFALVVVGMITIATITFQTWRVANDNPVKAIKNE
jgi:putative ABC transport system permease protein